MRRSVREALVGFSLLAAVAGGLGIWMWLKGLSFRSKTWTVRASFADAAGLAERSPVSFRGVLVGNVRRIQVNDQEVLAELEITDPKLRLSRPVVARVAPSSLLGGDAAVSLLSGGPPLPAALPGPRDSRCDTVRMVCDQGRVKGVAAASIDSVTETVQRLLDQADRDKLVDRLVAATASFERTSKETEKLTRDGQVFLADAQILVRDLNGSVRKVDPILQNITVASADAARASHDVSQLTAAIKRSLSNPKTLADLKATLANARALTARWEAVGGDVQKLSGDPRFVDGLRSVSAGLGRFFEDLYPASAAAGRGRGPRSAAGEPAPLRLTPQPAPRLAPRPAPPRGRALSAADQNQLRRGPQLPGTESGVR